MASQQFQERVKWITDRFYMYVEVSPTDGTKLQIVNIDKFGTPVGSSCRIYRAETFDQAIKKAYEQELQKLAKS